MHFWLLLKIFNFANIISVVYVMFVRVPAMHGQHIGNAVEQNQNFSCGQNPTFPQNLAFGQNPAYAAYGQNPVYGHPVYGLNPVYGQNPVCGQPSSFQPPSYTSGLASSAAPSNGGDSLTLGAAATSAAIDSPLGAAPAYPESSQPNPDVYSGSL